MKLYRTDRGAFVEYGDQWHALSDRWDGLINHNDLPAYLRVVVQQGRGEPRPNVRVLAPLESQEVWAAGVTYTRSREARVEESKASGGATFYDKVYDAVRPELFFKSVAWRVRATNDAVRIRRDATWSVPEPELALVINAKAHVVGFTIGNDMSSRDIEGENPLYLPQAKMYDGSCALGPCILVADGELSPTTAISISITRDSAQVFAGSTIVGRIKRTFNELVEHLYREMTFRHGAILLTGTGVVPPDNFTLASGDLVEINIDSIGTLLNRVE